MDGTDSDNYERKSASRLVMHSDGYALWVGGRSSLDDRCYDVGRDRYYWLSYSMS